MTREEIAAEVKRLRHEARYCREPRWHTPIASIPFWKEVADWFDQRATRLAEMDALRARADAKGSGADG